MTDTPAPHDARGATLDARLDRRDAAAIAARTDVDGVFLNDSRWWQNASFALPLIVSVIALAIGAVTRLPEAIGFGLFVAVVTLIMGPVVLLTWRSTATAIVLTTSGAFSLHHGTVLHELTWPELLRIEEVEYLGNRRYKLVHGEDERFMTVESEVERSADLVDRAFALSGLPRQREEAQPGGTGR